MSFQDLVITIAAENLASSEFSRVAVDATRMGADIRSSVSMAGAEFAKTGVEATAMGESVKASGGGFEELQGHAEASRLLFLGGLLLKRLLFVSLPLCVQAGISCLCRGF